MTATKRPRAPALPPQERRRLIVEAALPLIARNGRAVTSAQIARAAGVAEGTVYRVFPDKPSILEACLAHVLDTTDLERDLRAASARPTADRRMGAMAEALQRHLSRALPVALALGAVTGRTGGDRGVEVDGGRDLAALVAIVARHLRPDAGAFRVSSATVARVLVALVFGAAFQEAHGGAAHLGAREHARVVLSGLRRGAATSQEHVIDEVREVSR